MKIKRETLISSVGAGLEYYDFIVYGLLAGYLSQLFFQSSSDMVALIQTFAVFFVGYLARPVGGLIFGLLGDKYGRKNTFLTVMLLMAASTFLIGCLPVYDRVGVIAPVLLLILRVIQGLSFGAELPNAMTVTVEFSDEKEKGYQSSFVISSMSLGAMLASFVSFLLAKYFIETEILDWAWRLPFILGGILAIVSYYVRKSMRETPAYRAHLEENQIEDQTSQKIFAPLKELFKSHKVSLLRAIGILTLMSSLVVSVVFWVSYIPNAYGFERSDVYFATTLSMIWSALSVPLMGFLSDRIGRKRAILIFTGLFMLSIRPMVNMLHAEDVQSLILFFVIYQTFISGLFANYFALLSEIFPTRIRFTAIALCYNLVTTCAAMIPSYLSYQQTITPGPQTIIQFYLIVAVVTAIGALTLKDKLAPQKTLSDVTT